MGEVDLHIHEFQPVAEVSLVLSVLCCSLKQGLGRSRNGQGLLHIPDSCPVGRRPTTLSSRGCEIISNANLLCFLFKQSIHGAGWGLERSKALEGALASWLQLWGYTVPCCGWEEHIAQHH